MTTFPWVLMTTKSALKTVSSIATPATLVNSDANPIIYYHEVDDLVEGNASLRFHSKSALENGLL